MVGAEMPMTSDQVIWSEQNRLHISYTGCTLTGPGAGTFVFSVPTNALAGAVVQNLISINDTIVVLNPVTGAETKGIVSDSGVSVQPYAFTDLQAVGATGAGLVGTVKIFVYGSDYQKGQSAVGAAAGANAIAAANPMVTVNPAFTTFSNNPIIVRSQYSINGSDTANRVG